MGLTCDIGTFLSEINIGKTTEILRKPNARISNLILFNIPVTPSSSQLQLYGQDLNNTDKDSLLLSDAMNIIKGNTVVPPTPPPQWLLCHKLKYSRSNEPR